MNRQGEDLQTFLQKLINRIYGLLAIAISDRDGVSLLKVTSQNYVEDPSEAVLAATFAVASEQASKLRMGKNKTITSFFEDKILVHFNHLPLVISFIGTKNLNVGEILSFGDEIKKALDPIKASIKDSEKDI
mmetsp:Transcript_18551/g.26022  ORF Transcript_18551/g.26022 Transcript_18551/m.26022 type:complete len:132 (+) Transcript_18551:97-492(+)